MISSQESLQFLSSLKAAVFSIETKASAASDVYVTRSRRSVCLGGESGKLELSDGSRRKVGSHGPT